MVDSAVAGLEALESASALDYSGASGPCDFDEKGGITGTQYLFKRIENGSATEFRRV